MTVIRVLMLDPSSYTPYYNHSLCKALGEVGCDVELVTAPFVYDRLPEPELYQRRYGFARLLRLGGQPVLRGQRRLRRLAKALEYPLDWAILWRQIRSHPPDLVHVQWSIDPTLDAWWLTRLRRHNLPVVYTAHNVTPHPGEPTRRSGFHALYAAVDAIIVLAEANRAELLESFEIPAKKVYMIPSGHLFDFHQSPIDRNGARKQLGLPEGVPVALFFGLIKPYKGLEVLIRAFTQVHERMPAARLMIAGQPNMDFKSFDALIQKHHLQNAVTLDLRYIPTREMHVYFAAADVVVLPYLRTSQSAVLLMAYTFGRPVITTDTGGLPEMVVEGQSGLVVPPGDEVALAEALVTVLANPDRARSMGACARHLAQTRHAWPTIARATMDVYQKVLNREVTTGVGAPGM